MNPSLRHTLAVVALAGCTAPGSSAPELTPWAHLGPDFAPDRLDQPAEEPQAEDGTVTLFHPLVCGGERQWQHVEQYDGTDGASRRFVDAHERPVARMGLSGTGITFCTGTMISPDLFLTAGHCVDPAIFGDVWPTDIFGNPLSQADGVAAMDVRFDKQLDPFGNPKPVVSFDVGALVEVAWTGFVHPTLYEDYAILRISGSPGDTWGWSPVTDRRPVSGSQMTSISVPTFVDSEVPDPVTLNQKVVDTGAETRRVDKRWDARDIDIMGGSSGSPLFNEDGQVIGVASTINCDTGSANWFAVDAIAETSPTMADLLDDPTPLSVLLDRSGSMLIQDRCERSLDNAVEQIEAAAVAHPNTPVIFDAFSAPGGIGFIANQTGGWVSPAEAVRWVESLPVTGCNGGTPLADAICAVSDRLETHYPDQAAVDRRLLVSSDGGENVSAGPCSGPSSTTDLPYDANSWQYLAWDAVQDVARLDTVLWVDDIDLGPAVLPRGAFDVASSTHVEDGTAWLTDVTASTGGVFQTSVDGEDPPDPIDPSLNLGGVGSFDDVADWSTGSTPSELTTATRTEGRYGLSVASVGQTTVVAQGVAPADDLDGTGTSLAFDVYVPDDQANAYWYGSIQLVLVSPSEGVWYGDAGQVNVFQLETGTFHTLTFDTARVASGLLDSPATDLEIRIVLNVSAGSGDYVLDNLRRTD